MDQKIIINGVLADAHAPVIPAASRGFRYGDGCFETMRIHAGSIVLEELHFKRLFTSLRSLGFVLPASFTPGFLAEKVLKLCSVNNHVDSARVRLTVFRGNGGLYDEAALEYVIEASALDVNAMRYNEAGLTIGLYDEVRKPLDRFSNIKSTSFLPYVMAAQYAAQNKLDDVFILNSSGRIADASIANIFIVHDDIVKTPALGEGCIAGVTRQYLVDCCKGKGIAVMETGLSTADILVASEIFLTNAIRGIRWVQKCDNTTYTNNVSAALYNDFIKPLFA